MKEPQKGVNRLQFDWSVVPYVVRFLREFMFANFEKSDKIKE
jgi:hypothetical protein